jgi:excisionase family DNA binding protein
MCGSSLEKYYSVSSASMLIDCSEQFFRNLIRDRKIGFVKFGRMVRIPVSEIDKLKIEFMSISAIYDKAIVK